MNRTNNKTISEPYLKGDNCHPTKTPEPKPMKVDLKSKFGGAKAGSGLPALLSLAAAAAVLAARV